MHDSRVGNGLKSIRHRVYPVKQVVIFNSAVLRSMHTDAVVGSRAHHASGCHWLANIVRSFWMCAFASTLRRHVLFNRSIIEHQFKKLMPSFGTYCYQLTDWIAWYLTRFLPWHNGSTNAYFICFDSCSVVQSIVLPCRLRRCN